jgi:hypothetical protein
MTPELAAQYRATLTQIRERHRSGQPCAELHAAARAL